MTEQENPQKDKAQVGLSIEGNDHIEYLTKVYKWFEDGQDAYRTACAVALARGFKESDLPNVRNRTTKYGIGTLDPTGSLRDLICIMRPELSARPYASSEWLAEIGLNVIRTELDTGALLVDILEGEKKI
jgi:hypothetical protein